MSNHYTFNHIFYFIYIITFSDAYYFFHINIHNNHSYIHSFYSISLFWAFLYMLGALPEAFYRRVLFASLTPEKSSRKALHLDISNEEYFLCKIKNVDYFLHLEIFCRSISFYLKFRFNFSENFQCRSILHSIIVHMLNCRRYQKNFLFGKKHFS